MSSAPPEGAAGALGPAARFRPRAETAGAVFARGRSFSSKKYKVSDGGKESLAEPSSKQQLSCDLKNPWTVAGGNGTLSGATEMKSTGGGGASLLSRFKRSASKATLLSGGVTLKGDGWHGATFQLMV